MAHLRVAPQGPEQRLFEGLLGADPQPLSDRRRPQRSRPVQVLGGESGTGTGVNINTCDR